MLLLAMILPWVVHVAEGDLIAAVGEGKGDSLLESDYRYSTVDDNRDDHEDSTSDQRFVPSLIDDDNRWGREITGVDQAPLMLTNSNFERILTGIDVTTTEGNCAVDGNCFSNLNHGNSEDCTWVVEGISGTLEFSQFNVESHSSCNFDYLLISGTKYCGATAPTNLGVTAGDEIKWHSDGSVTTTGFNVCVTFSCTATCGAGSEW